MSFNSLELRVLGSLIEKETATPESYPLSLNALMAACNQRSSREPVLTLTEDEVRQTVHALEERELVAAVRDARVPKYEHRARTVWKLRRDETAVMCLLLLRGPQTVGELRTRADRLYTFDDLSVVQGTLDRLAARDRLAAGRPEEHATGPLVRMLARQPGARESRWAHLLGDGAEAAGDFSGVDAGRREDAGAGVGGGAEEAGVAAGVAARVAALEGAVEALLRRVRHLEESGGAGDLQARGHLDTLQP